MRNQRESPEKRMRERIREERKETSIKPSTRTLNKDMRDQVEAKGESEQAKAKSYTGETTVRKNQQVGKEETESQVVRTGKEADERKRKRGDRPKAKA